MDNESLECGTCGLIHEARKCPGMDTDRMRARFDVLGFGGGCVVVVRKSDGAKGSLDFDNSPRVYRDFMRA